MTEIKSTVNKESAAAAAESPAPLMIDLGKHKRKQVKRLLRGEGRLYEKVQDAVDELREVGKMRADAQLVYVSVKNKRRRKNISKCGLGLLR